MAHSAPLRSDAEASANATFDALMWAFSRPGQIKTLPQTGELCLIEALMDRECRVYCADPLLLPDVMRSGAEVADIPQADHLILGTLTDATFLKQMPLGSDLYPDDGATVIVRATLGAGPALRLSGPGVNGSVTVNVSGLPNGFWDMRKQVMRYPTGFELILLDGNRVLALPRSTVVEVL
ncbi:phosphonate C-P lyase system protein PhnH [Shimia sp.]|uniref:phosphonate C-P lyase system protein PhnH n=1 Tax=Shimia sp. TaxID=1954381 RepID=UPI003B8C2846